ncbi:UdgX family uracil-DNA binding protein [Nocardioides marinquilinus]|uniref:Type-4 uracil-DNA glycosylase n=1 Tax=Nocardioides marinquilinus TaxID=1210400 RepID=A0ABP9PMU4_9ACTN
MATGTDERPGAAAWVPDTTDPDALREAAQGCQGCELYRDATQTVMGQGDPSAPLLLLGEQPGDTEDREGKPFVGPAGRVLVSALGEAGIEAREVYRTNVVKHFRWKAGRGKQRIHQSPTQAHIRACSPWLVAELAGVEPRGIVLLGGSAGKAVHGTGFRVGEARGRFEDWPVDRFPTRGGTPWVLATLHPSAVLRADDADRDELYRGLVADLTAAAARLREG